MLCFFMSSARRSDEDGDGILQRLADIVSIFSRIACSSKASTWPLEIHNAEYPGMRVVIRTTVCIVSGAVISLRATQRKSPKRFTCISSVSTNTRPGSTHTCFLVRVMTVLVKLNVSRNAMIMSGTYTSLWYKTTAHSSVAFSRKCSYIHSDAFLTLYNHGFTSCLSNA